jgi:hypothetical protein
MRSQIVLPVAIAAISALFGYLAASGRLATAFAQPTTGGAQ